MFLDQNSKFIPDMIFLYILFIFKMGYIGFITPLCLTGFYLYKNLKFFLYKGNSVF